LEKTAIIAALVEHKPGVLFKVANMFRRRDFNIDGITVGVSEHRDLARMTITVKGDEVIREQVVRQLRKLVEVLYVDTLPIGDTVQRELALVKLKVGGAEARRELMDYTNIFRGRIIDASPQSMIVEITGTPDKMDAFINLVSKYGILEIARTGITALVRGKGSYYDSFIQSVGVE